MKTYFLNINKILPLFAAAFIYSSLNAEVITIDNGNASWDSLGEITAVDNVLIKATTASAGLIVNTPNATAGSVSLEATSNKASLSIYNDCFLDLGDGSINTVNSSGQTITPSSSAFSQIFINNESGGVASSSFFNAKSISVFDFHLASSNLSSGGAAWQINRNDAVYDIANSLYIASFTTAGSGSGINQTAGIVKAREIHINKDANQSTDLFYNLTDAILYTNKIVTAANFTNSTNKHSVAFTTNFNFDGGIIRPYSGTEISISKGFWDNKDTFRFRLGDKTYTDEYGFVHSANIFEGTLGLGGGHTFTNMEGKKGGFTLKNGGTSNSWIGLQGITGKVSLLGNTTFKQNLAGDKGFICDMYIEKGSTYFIVSPTSYNAYLFENQTMSGAGTFKVAKDVTINGTIAPISKTGTCDTFFIASDTAVNVKLSKTAKFEIDILGDFSDFDKINIGGNSFVEATAGQGLGKIVFTINGVVAAGSHSIAASDMFIEAGNTDWSNALLELAGVEGDVTFENGNFIFNVIPEPATVAMLLGFIGLGAAIIVRRKNS